MTWSWVWCLFYNIPAEKKSPFMNLLQRNWKTLDQKAALSIVYSSKNYVES